MLVLQLSWAENALRLLKKLGAEVMYKRPASGQNLCLSVVVFAEVRRKLDHGQLSILAGILFWTLAENFVFYALSSLSHKSKCLVTSVSAAVILAASERIDEGKLLCKVATIQLGISVGLIAVMD